LPKCTRRPIHRPLPTSASILGAQSRRGVCFAFAAHKTCSFPPTTSTRALGRCSMEGGQAPAEHSGIPAAFRLRDTRSAPRSSCVQDRGPAGRVSGVHRRVRAQLIGCRIPSWQTRACYEALRENVSRCRRSGLGPHITVSIIRQRHGVARIAGKKRALSRSRLFGVKATGPPVSAVIVFRKKANDRDIGAISVVKKTSSSPQPHVSHDNIGLKTLRCVSILPLGPPRAAAQTVAVWIPPSSLTAHRRSSAGRWMSLVDPRFGRQSKSGAGSLRWFRKIRFLVRTFGFGRPLHQLAVLAGQYFLVPNIIFMG